MKRYVIPALMAALSVGLAVQGASPTRAAQSGGIQVSTLTSFAPGTSTAAAGAANNGDVVALVGSNVVRVGPQGQQTVLATIPPGSSFGFPIGVAENDSQQIFVADPRTALNFITPVGPPQGVIWQVGPTGKLSVVPGSQNMLAPDGFGFDSRGNMYVTDIAGGSIWKVTPGGTAQPWVTGLNLPDGVKVFNNKVYTSLEAGQIATIPINPDGSAGTPQVWYQHNGPVFFDDMVLDDRTGDVYVAALDENQILQITPQGTETPVASCAVGGLAGAANMGLIHVGNDAVIYLANGGTPLFGPACPTTTGPNIVKITIPDKS